MNPEELLASWHTQQTAYIELRELRTRAMLDVLQAHADQLGRPLRVLDLGCGPGTLGTAVLERMPQSEVVGIDRDPILLRLGRETNRFGSRLQLLDLDLAGPDWVTQLPHQCYDAAISATALHWLDPDHLVGLYVRLASVMSCGGIFMNADHLYYDPAANGFLSSLSEQLRDQFQAESLVNGTLSWHNWWQLALAQAGWESEAAAWHERWADKHDTIQVSPQFHTAALNAAGFTETGQIYQWFDDRVIFGRLPVDVAQA